MRVMKNGGREALRQGQREGKGKSHTERTIESAGGGTR